jgi:F-type H+-transporting ATPase subunit b
VQLSWPTFILEIVNFLVLVWILKRFLYKPVLAAIAQRKAAIDKTLADAKARQSDAEALEQQYQNRLADWEKEKEALRSRELEEVAALRTKRMEALENSLAQERERAAILNERRAQETVNQAREEAIRHGVSFTARLLERVANPELETRLVDLVLGELPALPPEQLEAIRTACRASERAIEITSAFPIPPQQRSAIVQKLHEVIRETKAVEFNEDSSLLSGLRVVAGPWVLRANLQDELQFFASATSHGSQNH